MSANYTDLNELRTQKKLLKNEISELEDLLTFKNKKDSLSIMTNGLTDKFLKETQDSDGSTSLAIDTQNIMKEISSGMKEAAFKKNIVSLAGDTVKSGLLENTLRMGAVALVGNYAKKSVMNKSWKKKIIGVALIYV
uniref:phosphoribosyl-ATP pyrophosphatase n=1 Tax=Epilithonimonas vandammei TaxID=2487072 RepID=UPI0028A0924D